MQIKQIQGTICHYLLNFFRVKKLSLGYKRRKFDQWILHIFLDVFDFKPQFSKNKYISLWNIFPRYLKFQSIHRRINWIRATSSNRIEEKNNDECFYLIIMEWISTISRLYIFMHSARKTRFDRKIEILFTCILVTTTKASYIQ